MITTQPKYTTRVITENGLNNDIIKAIHKAIPEATREAKIFSNKFKGSNNLATSKNIYEFLRTLKYKKDPEGKQFIKLPNRLIATNGDCKSYSLLTAAILKNLGLPITFRYTSYSPTDTTPSHVYVITKDEKGKNIIIDGVYNHFNAEVPYQHKHDYKMQIAVLNGITQQEAKVTQGNKIKSLQNIKPGSFLFNVIQNEKARKEGRKNNFNYSGAQLNGYLIRLKKRRALTPVNSWVHKMFSNEIRAIENGTFSGTIKLNHSNKELSGIENEIGKLSLKKLGSGIKKGLRNINPRNLLKGVKAVTFVVPRKSFQALVALNVRGLATRMSKAPNEMIKVWEKFGGKASGILDAIQRGAKKKPLLGAGKKVKQIRGIEGIDYTVNENITGIGLEPVSTAAIIAASAPILIAIIKALKNKGIPETEGSTEDLLKEAENNGGNDIVDQIKNFANQAIDVATNTGIIPERPLSSTEQSVNTALPVSDLDETKTNFEINPLLIGGAALAAIFLLKKQSK